MATPYGTFPSSRRGRYEFGVHYFQIFFQKGNKHGTPSVGLDEEGTNALDEFIRVRITGNRGHDIFKGRKDLDGHSLFQRRSLF